MKPIQQSVCYPMIKPVDYPMDKFFAEARRIGYPAVEMWGREANFDEVCQLAKKHGLAIASMCGHGTLPDGLNRRENHARIAGELKESIAIAKERGIRGLICFSGNRNPGQSEEDAIAATVESLKKSAPLAEKAGVNLNMELLNSKVDHAGYQCDRSAWGLEVVKRVNSPNVKLLFDIYHMQIMEGDIIRTLRDNLKWIGHFHTAGNPGRNDIDDDQELNYRGICRAIAKADYAFYVGHEFKPKGDPIQALRQTYELCQAG